MNYITNYGHGLHRLVYASRANIPADELDRVTGQIVAEAATNNNAQAITGVLLATHGCFIQVLEGSYAMLQPLYDRIVADNRHSDVTLKLVEPASSRLFAGWGMRRVSPPGDESPKDVNAMSGTDLLQLLRFVAQMAEAKRPTAS